MADRFQPPNYRSGLGLLGGWFQLAGRGPDGGVREACGAPNHRIGFVPQVDAPIESYLVPQTASNHS